MKNQLDLLEQSIPEKYDDGIAITENKALVDFELNEKMAVNNRTLGKCRFKLMTAYYQYKRKKARWISTALRVSKIMLPLDECKELYRTRNKQAMLENIQNLLRNARRKTQKNNDSLRKEREELVEFEPKIYPQSQSAINCWGFRVLSIITAIY